MMKPDLIELDRFHGTRFVGTQAEQAHRLLTGLIVAGDTAKLKNLLRTHLRREVSPREAKKRYSVDVLLEYYSLLELGIASGVFPAELPDKIRAAADLLNVPAVRSYYEKNYPLLLPRLFAARLSGFPLLDGHVGDASRAWFVALLNVNSTLDDEDVGYFLDFLEDAYYDEGEEEWVGLTDLLDLLFDPRRLTRSLLVPPDDQGYLDSSVQGLLKFLQFCGELDDLLLKMNDVPALQSAFWHFHGYWLALFSNSVSSVMLNAIDTFRSWVPAKNSTANLDKIRRIENTLLAMTLAEKQVERLTSGIYRAYLDNVVLNAGQQFAGGKARQIVTDIRADDPQLGKIYEGRVTQVRTFGCFVEYVPGKEGLCHISQLANERVAQVQDVVKEGDFIWVKCIKIDDDTHRVSLSRKAAIAELAQPESELGNLPALYGFTSVDAFVTAVRNAASYHGAS